MVRLVHCGLIGIFFSSCLVIGISEDRERLKITQVLENARDQFKKQSLFKACEIFKNQELPGTMFFVIDGHDRWFFLNNQVLSVWQTTSHLTAFSGTDSLVHDLRMFAASDVWIPCLLYNSLVHARAYTVERDGEQYLIGAVHMAWHPEEQVEALIARAQNAIKRDGLSVVPKFNNPEGDFIFGMIGIALYDQVGRCLAYPVDLTRVGDSVIDFRDDAGVSLFEQYKRAAREGKQYGWCTYRMHGALRKDCVALVHVEDAEPNMLVTGYYPERTVSSVKKLVADAKQMLLQHGPDETFLMLSDVSGPGHQADLSIVVYGEDGTILAHGAFPALVGINSVHEKDEHGRHRVKEMIELVQKQGSGWVVTTLYNAPMAMYVEGVSYQEKNYIFTVWGYTSGELYYQAVEAAEAIEDYIRSFSREYVDIINLPVYLSRGGLKIVIYTDDGYCIYSNREDVPRWHAVHKKLLHAYQKRAGGGWIKQRDSHGTTMSYVCMVEKNDRDRYIITLSYEV